jgi:hypothetical protein
MSVVTFEANSFASDPAPAGLDARLHHEPWTGRSDRSIGLDHAMTCVVWNSSLYASCKRQE